MKYLLILSLIIIVISGCISQTTTTTSTRDGVIITDFSFDRSLVYAKENVGLQLEVQNIGDSKAKLKKVQLYGVDFADSKSTELAWGRRNEDVVLEGNEIDNRILDQPYPEANIEGGKFYHEWRLQAPSKILAETKYDFLVRVDYDYSTTYTGIIRLVNEAYLQSLSEEEREKLYGSDGIISSELTKGPISVIPFSGRHFVVDDLEPRTIKFKIENVGKGYTYLCPEGAYCVNDDDNANKSYVRITTKPSDLISCQPEVKLSSGKSHVIDCTFYPSSVENKVDKTFQIELEYSYYVDGYASITVKPTFEGGFEGGEGGCPMLKIYDGEKFVEVGPLNIHSVEGKDTEYLTKLSMKPVSEGVYEIHLEEANYRPLRGSHIDSVKLIDETGKKCQLISALHSKYGNVLEALAESDEVRITTDPGEDVILMFGGCSGDDFTFSIEGYNPLIFSVKTNVAMMNRLLNYVVGLLGLKDRLPSHD